MRAGAAAIAAGAAAAAALPARAQSDGGHMGWHETWGWGWWGHPFGFLLMLAFWAAVVLAIAGLIRLVAGGRRDRRPAEPPARRVAIEILEERYARGEIGRDEYMERRCTLEGGS